jgi:hypothetical protein
VVILNDVTEDGRQNTIELDRRHQYVYLVDDAQNMMLIVKGDFSEMSEKLGVRRGDGSEFYYPAGTGLTGSHDE